MIRLALLANLVAYSVVVSQPLAYAFFLTRAQRALSAAAYVELRQRINPVMNRRVPVAYACALVTGLVSLGLAIHGSNRSALASTAIALSCLAIDAIAMIRENVPINGAVDRWSTTDPPADWADYRERWFSIFAYRQVVLLLGFLALLVGAVFQS